MDSEKEKFIDSVRKITTDKQWLNSYFDLLEKLRTDCNIIENPLKNQWTKELEVIIGKRVVIGTYSKNKISIILPFEFKKDLEKKFPSPISKITHFEFGKKTAMRVEFESDTIFSNDAFLLDVWKKLVMTEIEMEINTRPRSTHYHIFLEAVRNREYRRELLEELMIRGITNQNLEKNMNSLSKCSLCSKEITFFNKPGFGKGKILNGETICSKCFLELKDIVQLDGANLENYSAQDLKQIIAEQNPLLNRIKQQIKDLSIESSDLLFVKKEIEELQNILFTDENIEALVTGVYFGDSNLGILLLTNKRLLFLRKSLLYGWRKEDYVLNKISSIQYEAGLISADLKIISLGNMIKVTQVAKKKAIYFCDKVRSNLNKLEVVTKTEAGYKGDIFGQLEKLANLKEKGILTQDEFDAEKKKLLNN